MVLENFLCCFELEAGGIFLGWFGIFTSVPQLLGFLYFAIFSAETLKTYQGENELQYGVSNAAEDKIQIANFRIIMVVCTVVTILKLLVSISLLNGTMTRNHKKLIPYLIYDGIWLGLYLIFVVLLAPFKIFVRFPVSFFLVYFTGCIFALYKKFENESKQGLITHVDSSYGQRQGLALQQPQAYQQPQGYHQPQAYQKPQGFQQPQAYYQPQGFHQPQAYYQPQGYPQTLKFEDASGLPSYDFVVPSKTQIE